MGSLASLFVKIGGTRLLLPASGEEKAMKEIGMEGKRYSVRDTVVEVGSIIIVVRDTTYLEVSWIKEKRKIENNYSSTENVSTRKKFKCLLTS